MEPKIKLASENTEDVGFATQRRKIAQKSPHSTRVLGLLELKRFPYAHYQYFMAYIKVVQQQIYVVLESRSQIQCPTISNNVEQARFLERLFMHHLDKGGRTLQISHCSRDNLSLYIWLSYRYINIAVFGYIPPTYKEETPRMIKCSPILS